MHASDHAELLLRMLQAPRRNHFFYGKRMDVDQFRMEQDYGKHKQWLLNRLALGKGVLCGLAVSVDGERLCVEPGVAIDGLGREIVVPVRACVDPRAPQGGCCDAPAPAAADERLRDVFTLWLCYRECHTDEQPVLVTDCETRSACAPGTVVESFCLKVTPGLPPLQGDPPWCLDWARGSKPPGKAADDLSHSPSPAHADPSRAALARLGLKPREITAVLKSRRHALCQLPDPGCDPAQGEACVPLAIGLLREQRIAAVESCLVRPRVYSNAVLLDLILCLAERVDACCNRHPAPPPPPPRQLLRVAGVSFLSIGPDGSKVGVAQVESPLDDLKIDIRRRPNAIRVRFTADFAQDAHSPSTHGYGDGDFKRHNVMVLPDEPLNGQAYVPGTLQIEDARTFRFELLRDSPYARGEGQGGFGWQKGVYRLVLFGDADAGAGRQALADTGGVALDGERTAPAGGALSGNGTPGGVFELTFVIG